MNVSAAAYHHCHLPRSRYETAIAIPSSQSSSPPTLPQSLANTATTTTNNLLSYLAEERSHWRRMGVSRTPCLHLA